MTKQNANLDSPVTNIHGMEQDSETEQKSEKQNNLISNRNGDCDFVIEMRVIFPIWNWRCSSESRTSCCRLSMSLCDWFALHLCITQPISLCLDWWFSELPMVFYNWHYMKLIVKCRREKMWVISFDCCLIGMKLLKMAIKINAMQVFLCCCCCKQMRASEWVSEWVRHTRT